MASAMTIKRCSIAGCARRSSTGRKSRSRKSCLAVGDCAFLSFPGELYTEIGQAIKAASPFKHTYILGLANGHIGYVPTRKAIHEGGYAEDTRGVDETAEEIIVQKSLDLLRQVHTLTKRK